MAKWLSKGAFFFVLLAMTACIQQKKAGSVVDLTEKDNGVLVAVIQGDVIRISLDGNPTTGFTWEPENLDTNLLRLKGDPVFKPSSSLKGSGGLITLEFLALKPGVTILRLIYHRSFEKGVPPVDIFEVTLDIQ